MELLPTKEVVRRLQGAVLGGRKTPHKVSQPLIYFDGANYRLAAFSFLYSPEDIRSACIGRPTLWAVADLRSGELLEVYRCRERDFSSAGFEERFDIRTDGVYDTSPAYYERTYALLDRVREILLSEGRVDWDAYGQYVQRILQNIPASYHRFYHELSISKEKGEQPMEPENLTPEQTEPVPPVTEQAAPEPPAAGDAAQTPPVEKDTAPEPPVEQPAEPSGGESPRELLDKLDELQQAMASLQESFDDKLAEDAHKNKLFDEMHRELVGYQNGAMDKVVDTMALDIIQLIDSTRNHVGVYQQKEPTEESYQKLLRVVKGLVEDLTDILYRQNIEAYRVEGDEVDVRRQKIIQTLPTDNPAKDNRVAARSADGYEKNGKIFRPERVKIFKYTPPAADAADQ